MILYIKDVNAYMKFLDSLGILQYPTLCGIML